MMRSRITWFVFLAAASSLAAGCRLREPNVATSIDSPLLNSVVDKLDYPDLDAPHLHEYGTTHRPFSVTYNEPTEYWTLELSEAVQTALTNSKVFRDLGGAVLASPALVRTILDPAVVETDPRFGVAAALSAFDAQFGANGIFQNNDRVFNNEVLGGGTRIFKQDLDVFQSQLSKRTVGGSEFFLRQNVEYDANNADANQFPSAWNVDYEVEFRQALGQGRGVAFNQIAGPGGVPGQLNGVVLARTNTDISLADFEIALRDLVSNVENAYWELYFAYRDFEVKIGARDQALKVWRSVESQAELPRGAADREAQAREQYFRFKEEVQNALSGRLTPRTGSNRGIPSNAFSPQNGVFVAERNLRLLMGLPANDGRLIRPKDEPTLARVLFDWDEVTVSALVRRAELRRQRSRVRRRELVAIANRNFLLPRLDAIARYRVRGFGHDLISANRGKSRFDNAYMDLTTGDFQEWEVGLELGMPIGFRQAHSAVRNAQLQLARERAILEEQERLVVHDLSNVLAELDRAYEVLQTALNRRLAADTQLKILEDQRFEQGRSVDLNLILDAQRRKADADRGFFRSLAEYTLAIKNVHFAKGSLMSYHNIVLAEHGQGPAHQLQSTPQGIASPITTSPEALPDPRPEPADSGAPQPEPLPIEPRIETPAPEASRPETPLRIDPRLEGPLPKVPQLEAPLPAVPLPNRLDTRASEPVGSRAERADRPRRKVQRPRYSRTNAQLPPRTRRPASPPEKRRSESRMSEASHLEPSIPSKNSARRDATQSQLPDLRPADWSSEAPTLEPPGPRSRTTIAPTPNAPRFDVPTLQPPGPSRPVEAPRPHAPQFDTPAPRPGSPAPVPPATGPVSPQAPMSDGDLLELMNTA